MRPTSKCRPASFFSLCIALGILVAGCLRNEVTVKVKPDGSGNIVLTRVYPAENVSQFQSMLDQRERGDKKTKSQRDPFFDEKAIKREASTFGEGVTFVKARKFEKDGAQGWIALYAFKDITKVIIPIPSQQSAYMMMYGRMRHYENMADDEDDEDLGGEEEEDFGYMQESTDDAGVFKFKLTRNTGASLEITTPDYPAPTVTKLDPKSKSAVKDKDDESEFYDEDDESEFYPEMPEAAYMYGRESHMAQAHQLLSDARFRLVVEVEGSVAKSTTAGSSGKPNRFLLLDVNGPKMLASPSLKSYMADDQEQFGNEILDMLINARAAGLQGITLVTNRTVTINFK